VLDLIVIHDDLGWPDFAAVASTAGAATQALKLSSCVLTEQEIRIKRVDVYALSARVVEVSGSNVTASAEITARTACQGLTIRSKLQVVPIVQAHHNPLSVLGSNLRNKAPCRT
jgi:hypothetical protein